ncbi:efflux RND transporter periplasmic adaptor subunit [bacterium]|nr:efflux RND transporter periplasmic adaptor subunit [bacterium]
MRKLHVFVYPFLAFAITFAEPCVPAKKGPPLPGPGDVVFEVQANSPRFEEMARTVIAPGQFMASDRALVTAAVSGQIEKINVNEGDTVHTGDVLAIMQSQSTQLALDTKQAELKEAQAKLENVRKLIQQALNPPNSNITEADKIFLDEEVNEEAPKKELPPPPPVPQTAPQDDEKVLLATIDRLNKEIETLNQSLVSLTLLSPLDGIVKAKTAVEGRPLNAGDPLFDLISLNPITLKAHVPQDVSSYIDKMITVWATPAGSTDIKVQGVVSYVSPSIDPATGTLEIKMNFPNEKNAIKDGQAGEAIIKTRKSEKVLVVPKQAVLDEAGQKFVYVVSVNKALKTPVDIVQTFGDKEVGINADMRVDDLVITSGFDRVSNGSFVKIVAPTSQPQALTPSPGST